MSPCPLRLPTISVAIFIIIHGGMRKDISLGILGGNKQSPSQGDRKGRPYYTTNHLARAVYCRGDRKGRPYYTTNHLARAVYCRGDPCGRPGLGTACSPPIFLEICLFAFLHV